MAADATPAFAKWLLYKLVYLKDMADMLEPRTTAAAEEVIREKYFTGSSNVEKVAIKRASITKVVLLVDRAIASMHPELRQIYRLRFRSRYSYKQIMQRVVISESTLVRRLEEIVQVVIIYVSRADKEELQDFGMFFGGN